MSQDHYEEKYTDPELRRRLKEEILQSDKGGKPGQWSARKSQLLVREYESHGGGYKTDEKDEAARSLEIWSEQEWQTEAGDDRARDGQITKRYLPKAVWDQLSESEKEEAERSKEAASQRGLQHVEWTPAVKAVMERFEAEFEAEHDSAQNPQSAKDDDSENPEEDMPEEKKSKQELYNQAKQLNVEGRSKMNRQELIEAIAAKRRS